MYASQTLTRSESSTHTEARAQHVSDKVSADIYGLYSRGIISRDSMIEWSEVIDLCLRKNGLEKAQLKVKAPNGEEYGVSYSVVDSGQIYYDERSGGLDWYEFPKESSASIVIRRNSRGHANAEINDLLAGYGWTSGASFLEGSSTDEKCYSKDGFGVKRNKVGW